MNNRQRAKKFLEKNNIKDTVGLLKKCFVDESEERKEILLHSGRHFGNAQLFIKGLKTIDEFEVAEAKIILALTGLIDKIPDQVPLVEYTPQWVSNPILVICPEEERKLYMVTLFRLLRFESVKVVLLDEEIPKKIDFDLVVFDNKDLGDNPSKDVSKSKLLEERTAKMDQMLQSSFVLHFGGYLNWINENRESAYSVNSKFALHARVMEFLNFIDKYKA